MAENYIEEKELANQPKPMSLEELMKLCDLRKNICKIYCKDGCHGTGFFCKIPNDWNDLRVLMTNHHVLNLDDIQPGQTIKFSLENDSKEHNILIDNTRKTYTNKIYDLTIIEIKKEDKIENSYFDLDQLIFKENSYSLLRNHQIYLLHYPNGEKLYISNGQIKSINEDEENQTIQHLCDTYGGSSGGAIISKNTFQVIGIHKGAGEGKKNYNLGTFLKIPLQKFSEEMKKININNNKKENKENEKEIKNEEKNKENKENKENDKNEKNLKIEEKKENKNINDINDINNTEERKEIETNETIETVKDINDFRNFEEKKIMKI